ncbi:hypothetical protein DFH06DRAFT_1306979 [Mycena polygramma]|nr:hypothetical protein DFH06DRAFT_1306979 [Mycena polygramma]
MVGNSGPCSANRDLISKRKSYLQPRDTSNDNHNHKPSQKHQSESVELTRFWIQRLRMRATYDSEFITTGDSNRSRDALNESHPKVLCGFVRPAFDPRTTLQVIVDHRLRTGWENTCLSELRRSLSAISAWGHEGTKTHLRTPDGRLGNGVGFIAVASFIEVAIRCSRFTASVRKILRSTRLLSLAMAEELKACGDATVPAFWDWETSDLQDRIGFSRMGAGRRRRKDESASSGNCLARTAQEAKEMEVGKRRKKRVVDLPNEDKQYLLLFATGRSNAAGSVQRHPESDWRRSSPVGDRDRERRACTQLPPRRPFDTALDRAAMSPRVVLRSRNRSTENPSKPALSPKNRPLRAGASKIGYMRDRRYSPLNVLYGWVAGSKFGEGERQDGEKSEEELERATAIILASPRGRLG